VTDIFKEQAFSQGLVEEMIRKNLRQQVLQANRQVEENPAIKALLQEVESKLIILLSELASNKICESFLRNLA